MKTGHYSRWIVITLAIALLALCSAEAQELSSFVTDGAPAKIRAAAPSSASAKPAKARRILILTESAQDLAKARKEPGMKFVPHPSAPHCAMAVAAIGEKTGAFKATVTSDPNVISAGNLKQFDAIILANVYIEGKLFRVPRDLSDRDKAIFGARQKALLDYVKGGKGIVGIHNATCTALAWPEYNKMIGGTHHGHAWYAHQSVPIKLDEPKHPLNAAFGGSGFAIQDDIYAFTAPYSRGSVRVLLSADTSKAPKSMTADRLDGDYPVSWVKPYGEGRVFYTALGHNPATFENPKFLRHLLDGIQFATGDLKADASPGKPLPNKPALAPMAGWTPLFDGKDLSAWKGADQQKQHWVVEDGIIRYDGRAGSLYTKKSYRNYILRVDWRLPRKADSGVFVRGNKQLNIWTWSMGSGEMWEHRGGATSGQYVPSSREDRAVGEWNTFLVTVKDNRVTVILNGKKVISKAVLKDNAQQSPIGLQRHGDPLEFKSMYIKEL